MRRAYWQIVRKLRDAEAILNAGKDQAAVLQALEVSEATYLRWRQPATLLKTKHVEVVRMVLPQRKLTSEHKAPGEIVVQCLEGQIAFTAMGNEEELEAGQMLYLSAAEPHSVRAVENSSILLTILLNIHGS